MVDPSTRNTKASAGAEPSQRNPLDAIAESFVSRIRRGEYPALSEYTSQYPELADEIRDLLPTLAMLEKCGGEQLDAGAAADPKLPERIGEYRIIREIGRGGMGVVYESEHDKMRRRVALKVLPARSAAVSSHLLRFHREAQTAGRLHHTNIVPVFEVGSDQGTYYYAMQYIRGQSLDVVFDEQRQLKVEATSTEVLSGTLGGDLGKSVACHLYSGTFEVAAEDVETGAPAAETELATPSAPARDTSPAPRTSASESLLRSELRSTTARDDYFRRVARIGLQIADALAYAHAQGILHRDIKPANIILDTSGVAWVTDFGLAKQEDQNLTQSGDLVGTFRYMAPERFSGDSDARSDIYSLGLTLYELCTLTYAFSQNDRAALIRAVQNEQPPRPRSSNRQLPRDLETIILKSIEKRPQHRYQRARQLAEDLRLFLGDHPIKARQTWIIERAWRWCRRNPQQAILAASLVLLLVVMTAGSLVFGYTMARQARQIRSSQQLATVLLYDSLLGRAKATRWSGRPGQHYASLEDITAATKILGELDWDATRINREKLTLRNAAIAAMPLPDIRRVKSWSLRRPWVGPAAFDPQFASLAIADNRGEISIRSVHDDQEQQRLSRPPGLTAVSRLRYSHGGRFLAVHYAGETGNSLHIWDVLSGKVVVGFPAPLHPLADVSFSGDDRRMTLIDGRVLRFFEMPSAVLVGDHVLDQPAVMIDAHLESAWGAVVLQNRRLVQIWDLDSGDVLRSLTTESPVWSLSWHPHLQRLALGSHDGTLELVSPYGTTEESTVLKGHNSRIIRLRFRNGGDQLVSSAWDGTARLWDVGKVRQLLRIEGLQLMHDSAVQRTPFLGAHDDKRLELWEIADRPPHTVLRSPRPAARRWSVDIDPTGMLAASACNDGVEIWNLAAGKLAGFLPARPAADGRSKDALFLADGSGLLTSNTDGLVVWSLSRIDGPERMEFHLQPGRVLHPEQTTWVSGDAASGLVGVRQHVLSGMGLVVHLDDPNNSLTIGPHNGVDHVEVSPDGRWVATTPWAGTGIRIWDGRTGKPVLDEPLEVTSTKIKAAFSPDSRLLVASTATHHLAWQIGDWHLLYRIPRTARDEWPGPVAFSPDGRIVAVAESRFVLKLLEAETGRTLGVLDAPSEAGFHDCAFGPDGAVLAAASDIDLHVWDIGRIRLQLAGMGLDWDHPPIATRSWTSVSPPAVQVHMP